MAVLEGAVLLRKLPIIELASLHVYYSFLVNFYFADENFMVGSAEISDYPVVYCNSGFAQMTGFKRSEVMKLSCDGKFLLGSFAKKEVLERIQDALRCKKSCQEEFIGRKRDGIGLTYWGDDIVRIFYRENDGKSHLL